MKLDGTADSDIRDSLKEHGLKIALDEEGRILVHEYRMDVKAKAGMLYLKPENEIPKGELPFLITGGKGVYGVFYFNEEAVIIEVGFTAMVGEITDYHGQE